MSDNFAVLGKPISHSKSPAIHEAAYRVLGLEWSYARHEIAKGGLQAFLSSCTERGLSVTMPLKEEAFRLAVEVDEFAKVTGAANTLVRKNATDWSAFNTDIFGMIQAIQSKLAWKLQTALVIGSGATAMSAIVAISKIAPRSTVLIFARNASKRNELVDFAKSLGLQSRRAWFFTSAAAKAELVISTVPANVMDATAQRLVDRHVWKPAGLLLDVAYSPWPSKLANLWELKGRPVSSGLEMLIWQAIAQIRIFRNGDPTVELPNEIAVLEAMRNAVNS